MRRVRNQHRWIWCNLARLLAANRRRLDHATDSRLHVRTSIVRRTIRIVRAAGWRRSRSCRNPSFAQLDRTLTTVTLAVAEDESSYALPGQGGIPPECVISLAQESKHYEICMRAARICTFQVCLTSTLEGVCDGAETEAQMAIPTQNRATSSRSVRAARMFSLALPSWAATVPDDPASGAQPVRARRRRLGRRGGAAR